MAKVFGSARGVRGLRVPMGADFQLQLKLKPVNGQANEQTGQAANEQPPKSWANKFIHKYKRPKKSICRRQTHTKNWEKKSERSSRLNGK